MTKKVYYTDKQIDGMVHDIIRQMNNDNWMPDYVVGLTRGGLNPALKISHYLNIPMETLKVSLRDGGEEFASMRAIMKELKYLARATNSAIVVLHHTSEAIPGNPCQPRSAIQGKVSQLPALICTLGTVGTSLGVASVKNRYGRADAGGTLMTWLAFNPEYMYVEDIPENS